jgi:hypothetical protein
MELISLELFYWTASPHFETDTFTPRNFAEFFLLWAPPVIPSVTDACQGGSGLILRSAATLSVCLKSLSRKTLGLTPDTAYSRGEKHSEIECHKCWMFIRNYVTIPQEYWPGEWIRREINCYMLFFGGKYYFL